MIKVTVKENNSVFLEDNFSYKNSMLIEAGEIDQLIADLQEAAVRLKAGQLTQNKINPKSPTEKLEDEIAQLKERVNMLEYSNVRKL